MVPVLYSSCTGDPCAAVETTVPVLVLYPARDSWLVPVLQHIVVCLYMYYGYYSSIGALSRVLGTTGTAVATAVARVLKYLLLVVINANN